MILSSKLATAKMWKVGLSQQYRTIFLPYDFRLIDLFQNIIFAKLIYRSLVKRPKLQQTINHATGTQPKSKNWRKLKPMTIMHNHNYNKIVKSDGLSTALISALIGQFNRTVCVMPK